MASKQVVKEWGEISNSSCLLSVREDGIPAADKALSTAALNAGALKTNKFSMIPMIPLLPPILTATSLLSVG